MICRRPFRTYGIYNNINDNSRGKGYDGSTNDGDVAMHDTYIKCVFVCFYLYICIQILCNLNFLYSLSLFLYHEIFFFVLYMIKL